MIEVVRELFDYGGWATDRVIEAMRQLSAEAYTAPGCSGNGSIRDTFAHMLAAERRWFAWFDGSHELADAVRLELHGEEIATVDRAAVVAREVRARTDACLAALDDEAAARPWSFTRPGGISGTLPLWKMMLHVANHGTHTRAQVVAAIRRLGLDPGNIDLFRYARGA